MKKILIFNSGSYLYGSERGLVNLVKAIKDEYEVTVVLPTHGPLVKYLQRQNVGIKIFPLGIISFSFSPLYYLKYFFLLFINMIYFSFYAWLRKVDMLYTNNSLLIFPCFVSLLLRKKHIWHIREFFHVGLMNKVIAKLAKMTFSKIICQSENIKKNLFSGDEGLEVLYECIDLQEYKGIQKETNLGFLPEGAVVLSLIARIHPLKGQYEFVKLVREAIERLKNKVVLLLVGDISTPTLRNYLYRKKIERFIHRNNLREKIFILGFQEGIEKILFFSDICVFPFRRNEPFGLALLEALVFSCHVLVNPNPGFEEIVSFFPESCERLTPDTLKKAIERGKIIEKRIYLPEVFSFENYKRRILTLLR